MHSVSRVPLTVFPNATRNSSRSSINGEALSSHDFDQNSLFAARTAVLKSDKAELKKLLKLNLSIINIADNLGRTLLIYASSCDRHKILKHLLKYDTCLVDIRDESGQTALHWAIGRNRPENVKRLLRAGADPNIKNLDGFDAFHLSLKLFDTNCLRVLLQEVDKNGLRSTDDDVDVNGRGILHVAAQYGRAEHIQLLLKFRPDFDPDRPDLKGKTPLMIAASESNVDSLNACKTLVHKAPWSVRSLDDERCTVLHHAAGADNVPVLQWIFETRAIESLSLDAKHRTPFHWACRSGAWLAVQFLLDHCQNLHWALSNQDHFDCTPLHYAIESMGRMLPSVQNHENFHDLGRHIVRRIVELCDKKQPLISQKTFDQIDSDNKSSNAVLTAVDSKGRTALMRAVAHNLQYIVQDLFGFSTVDKNQKDHDGYSLLHVAAQKGNSDVLQYLIQCGLPLESLDIYGLTPFLVAAESGQMKCVEILLRAGADPARCDRQGRTALHWAALGGHALLCQVLVSKYNLNPQFTDSGGRTPLHCAAFVGDTNCVSVLLQASRETVCCVDHDGFSALHLAAEQHNLGVIRLLIEKGDAAVNLIRFNMSNVGAHSTALDLVLNGLKISCDASQPCLNNSCEIMTTADDAVVNYLQSVGGLTYEKLTEAAATKIQSLYRGYLVRRNVPCTNN